MHTIDDESNYSQGMTVLMRAVNLVLWQYSMMHNR
jgi:hypothetical protein